MINFPLKMRSRPLLSLVFFLSGFTALVYQVVWQRLLTLYYGVGAVSITVIVTVFMAGLGLGAILGGRLAEKVRDRMLAYAGIELCIGFFGAASFLILEALGRHTAGCSMPVAFFCISLFLLIPTTLMGMTLPLLTAIYNSLVLDFALTISHLYFINTLGAAAGSLLTAYVLITFGGLDTALHAAAAVNILLAWVVLGCRKRSTPRGDPPLQNPPAPLPDQTIDIRPLVFLTGFLAIGYEIVWFRFFGVLVKESPYAFATVLAVYLTGLAGGSLWMSGALARLTEFDRRKQLLFGMQCLIAGYGLLSFFGFFHLSGIPPFKWLEANSFGHLLHPPDHWPSFSWSIEFARQIFLTFDIVFWPIVFVLFPTFFMGATFPLMSVLSLRKPATEAKTVGSVYAWTIAGNVLGGLATGFCFLPFLGTENTVLLFGSGGILFFFPLWKRRRTGGLLSGSTWVLCASVLAVIFFFPRKTKLYDAIHPNFDYGETFIEEGREGVVVTFARGEKVVNFINGLAHGGRPNVDFMQEAVETLVYTGNPKRVLLIGYGTGELCDTLLRSPEVEELVIVELNHTLMANLRKIPLIRKSLADPRIRLVMDDGRRYLLRRPGTFDVICMDPIYHNTVYSNNLYSRQFFQLAGRHLSDRGVMMVWSSEHRVIPNTVAAVFPEVRSYDHYCLASRRPMVLNAQREKSLLATFAPEDRDRIIRTRDSAGGRPLLQRPSAGTGINEDWKPRCEYYLGLR
jgi:spermidine synthase